MQDWREIRPFPGYSVSNFGDVRNDKTERLMRSTLNTRGFPIVGLMNRGVQYKRAVNVLVGKIFIPNPRPETFNAIIHLDNDRTNTAAANLAWRPLWYARNHAQQFDKDPLPPLGPVEEVHTGQVFETTWDAALGLGLIEYDIRLSVKLGRPVQVTGHQFRLI